jgi:hypothetical protein
MKPDQCNDQDENDNEEDCWQGHELVFLPPKSNLLQPDD